MQPMAILIFNINKALGQEGMSYVPRHVASSNQPSEPKMTLHSFPVCFKMLAAAKLLALQLSDPEILSLPSTLSTIMWHSM